jgi:outer membrane murein-binding lipoprotein Lpp
MRAYNDPPSLTPGRLTVLAIAVASTLVAGQANAIAPNQLGTSNSVTVVLLENVAGRTVNGFNNTLSGDVGTLNNNKPIALPVTGLVT